MLSDWEFDEIAKLVSIAKKASLLEINSEPKIGNIGPGREKDNTTYKDFLISVNSIEIELRNFLQSLATKISNIPNINDIPFQQIGLGSFYLKATERMMNSQSGGNTLLGHILLFGPMVAGMYIFRKLRMKALKELIIITERILDSTQPIDSINLYHALRCANPGGLGTSEYLDVYSDSSFDEIKRDNVSMKKIFAYSQNYDSISSELSNNYKFSYNFSLPNLSKFTMNHPINNSVVLLILSVLAEIPDSLIVRKYGKELANEVRDKAKEILRSEPFSNDFLVQVEQLDKELTRKDRYVNPGTTADLTAIGVLIYLFIHECEIII